MAIASATVIPHMSTRVGSTKMSAAWKKRHVSVRGPMKCKRSATPSPLASVEIRSRVVPADDNELRRARAFSRRASIARSQPLSLEAVPAEEDEGLGLAKPHFSPSGHSIGGRSELIQIDAGGNHANPSWIDLVCGQEVVPHQPARRVDLEGHSILEDPSLDEPANEDDRIGDRQNRVL